MLSTQNLSANIDGIIDKINSINSLEFNFEQRTNGINENGKCLLKFPAKLKCDYTDVKQKELIINNKTLAVIQKKYNKVYYYPVSRSSFSQILKKDKLIQFIRSSDKRFINDEIHLINKDKDNQKISIIFDKKSFDLIGWKINDKFNNDIIFLIEIISTNKLFDFKEFIIPLN